MGKGRRYRVATRVVLTFIVSPLWAEEDLAQRIGTSARSTRRVLERLRDHGMPLLLREVREQRRWFVPSTWAALLGNGEELAALLETLWDLPPTPSRDALLARLLDGGIESTSTQLPSAWLSAMDGADRDLQQFLLQAALREYPVRVRCFSRSGPVFADRRLSIQRVFVGDKTTFLAVCHHSSRLAWYSGEDVVSAVKLRGEPYRRAVRAKVAALLEQGPPAALHPALAFRVRYPEARWIQCAVLPGMQIDEANSDERALRVVASQCGAVAVARFIASLGGAARAEGAALAGLVTGIAAATLSAHRLSDDAFGRKRHALAESPPAPGSKPPGANARPQAPAPTARPALNSRGAPEGTGPAAEVKPNASVEKLAEGKTAPLAEEQGRVSRASHAPASHWRRVRSEPAAGGGEPAPEDKPGVTKVAEGRVARRGRRVV